MTTNQKFGTYEAIGAAPSRPVQAAMQSNTFTLEAGTYTAEQLKAIIEQHDTVYLESGVVISGCLVIKPPTIKSALKKAAQPFWTRLWRKP